MNPVDELPSEVLDLQPEQPRGERWLNAKSLIAAIQFLTRLPIAPRTVMSAEVLRRSAVFYPLVGTIIGCLTSVLIGAGCQVWPVWLAVLLALGFEIWLTGALHEDGVADFCDAMGGGWTREEVLAILDDSRIGTFGALGLAFSLALRAAATVTIVVQQGPQRFWVWGAAIVASSMIGRWVMVLVMVCLRPAPRRKSLAEEVGGSLSVWGLLVAGLIGIPVVAWFGYVQPVQCLVAIILLSLIVWRFVTYVRRRIGGMTGDCIGCIGCVAQIVVLIAAAMSDRWRSDF